jgi:hypothetical protein
MKKTFGIAGLLAVIVLFCGFQARAQAPIRIQFAKGKSSAVLKGMSTGAYGVTYVLRAKSGQKLVISLTPASNVGIKVETKGRFGEMVLLREEHGGTFEVGIEETGDHTIFVGSLGSNPVTFTMTVQVKKLADI